MISLWRLEATGHEAKTSPQRAPWCEVDPAIGPTSKPRNPRCSTAFPAPMPSAVTGMQLTNSWSGTAPNHDCRSVKPWSSDTRMHLESRNLAPGTINLRLGAVRRLAYEAADCGLLSANLAAGIRRVKGVKKLGVRLGNWLTAEQGQALWQAPNQEQMKGKRDRALLALLLACGLRRHELASLTVGHLQQREGHWAIVDLRGKGGHVGCMAFWMTGQRPPELTRAAFSGG